MRTFIALALLIFAAGNAHARTGFSCVVDFAQTVTACSPSTASGTAVFILNDAQTELSYDITVTGLQGAETAAHFHESEPGTNGDIVHFLPPGGHKQGVWKSTDPLALTPELVAQLFAGNIYIVIHTQFCGAGEVRGNLSTDPTPARPTTWGRLKALYRGQGGALSAPGRSRTPRGPGTRRPATDAGAGAPPPLPRARLGSRRAFLHISPPCLRPLTPF